MKSSIKRCISVFVINLCIYAADFFCEAIQIDSDPHRQHNLEKPRYWKWSNTLTFCINGIIPCKFKTGNLFNADLAHLELADIERQFSFEVEQYRDKLRKELIEQKMLIEAEKIKIQSEQMSLEEKTVELKAQLTETQKEIDSVSMRLKEAPQIKRNSETAIQFRERKKSWQEREENKDIVAWLNTLLEKNSITISEETIYIDEALKLKKILAEDSQKCSEKIKQIQLHLVNLSEKAQQITTNVRTDQLERRLASISTTINVATVGVSLVLKKDRDSDFCVLFSPLQLKLSTSKATPVVFSSSSLIDMASKFHVIVPPRGDFATSLAMQLGIDKSSYFGTMASYSKLKDTEATAINYLLSNPGDYKYRNVLLRTIGELLEGTGYSFTDVKSLCIHIHTKKDPCALCTRLVERMYLALNSPEFIPEIKTVFKNVILISSCDDYRIGKARELFWKKDTQDSANSGAKPYDLSVLSGDYLFFKFLYGTLK